MSFLGGLKRALGWSDDDDDEDYITYGSSSDENDSVIKSEVIINEDVPAVDALNANGEIPEGVFDGLIEIINANLSPMVLKCLDVEAEKKYLYEALGPKFNDFVKETREKSLSAARIEWSKEKNELNSKIEDFKSRCDVAENEMREMKAMKMSEERQKTALKERLRNLEEQVAAVEAEKEQYDLEKKSLLNKLKVSQVNNDAVEEAEKEILELKAEIARMKAQPIEGVSEETVKALEEEYNAKMEVNNALINDLRAEAAKNKENLTESENVVAELQSMVDEIQAKLTEKETQLVSVSEERDNAVEQLKAISAELESSKEEISEMSESLAVLDDIQEQLVKVEEFKNKKNEEIQSLQEKVALLEEEKAVLEQEKAKAIEAVRDEDILKGRIAELELELSASAERLSALSQENSDTLEMLSKREDVIESQKSELAYIKTQYEALKLEFEQETNALKTAEIENTKKFQAEIADLQARLNVSGKLDDALVDDDLRQEVEDTFDVSLDDSDFGDFVEPIVELAPVEVMQEPEQKDEVESQKENTVVFDDAIPEAELDDIDWLLPDTVESVAQEEAVKEKKEREKAEQEQQEKLKTSPKAEEEPDAQMSLFG